MYCLVSEKTLRLVYGTFYLAIGVTFYETVNIDCTVNLIFGLPGESYETIDHTLGEMMKYPPNALRRYEYTIGGRIYQNTPLSHFLKPILSVC